MLTKALNRCVPPRARRCRRRLGLIVGLAFAVSSASTAQSVYLQGATQRTAFNADRSNWTETGAGVGIDAVTWDLYLQASQSARFDIRETRLMADGYRVLGRGTYTNLRLVWTPDASVHAVLDLLAEVFQDAGGGYEPSFQVRYMTYPDVRAVIVAPGLGRYSGNRYYRVQALAARSTDGSGGGFAVTAAVRTYRGNRNFVEIRASAGREVVDVRGAATVSRGYSIGVRADWGFGRLRAMPHLGWADDPVLGGRVEGGIQFRAGL
jgi:YaiO family outer membrane protein